MLGLPSTPSLNTCCLECAPIFLHICSIDGNIDGLNSVRQPRWSGFFILVRFKFGWRHYLFFPASENEHLALLDLARRSSRFSAKYVRKGRATECQTNPRLAYNKYGSHKSLKVSKKTYNRFDPPFFESLTLLFENSFVCYHLCIFRFQKIDNSFRFCFCLFHNSYLNVCLRFILLASS